MFQVEYKNLKLTVYDVKRNEFLVYIKDGSKSKWLWIPMELVTPVES